METTDSLTIEEENAKLREIIETHCMHHMNLCSQTLRDLRKLKRIPQEVNLETVIDNRGVNLSSKVYW